MDKKKLKQLLQGIKAGKTSVAQGLADLSSWAGAVPQLEDLGVAKLDHNRQWRCGHPEVIFGAGKTPDEVLKIAGQAAKEKKSTHEVLITRVNTSQVKLLKKKFGKKIIYNQRANTIRIQKNISKSSAKKAGKSSGTIAVVTAGTSDRPAAEEAVETLRSCGVEPSLFVDVGVAGIHRLLGIVDDLRSAKVLIVAAGMEGALPSVVGGLVPGAIVAVPTSVGYGVGTGGWAALAAMLNSCAAGITVVNIDNGFGAAMAALRIISQIDKDH